MAKIDRAKEYIGALKVYLALVTALLMGDIGGTVRLFRNGDRDFTFWAGTITIIVLSTIFTMIAKHMHKKINDLEDL